MWWRGLLLSLPHAVLSAWQSNVVKECICDSAENCPAAEDDFFTSQVKMISGQILCVVPWKNLVTAVLFNIAAL